MTVIRNREVVTFDMSEYGQTCVYSDGSIGYMYGTERIDVSKPGLRNFRTRELAERFGRDLLKAMKNKAWGKIDFVLHIEAARDIDTGVEYVEWTPEY